MPKKSDTKVFTCVDLFCGCGGFSLGLQNAGFQILAAYDWDKNCIQTYNHNIRSSPAIQKDICELKGKDVLRNIGLSKGQLTLLVAGPSCQGFSNINKGSNANDSRNKLVFEVVRLVGEILPEVFVMENVASINTRGKEYIDFLFKHLEQYDIVGALHNSANYGVPQTRERYIVVGVRRDTNMVFEPQDAPVDKRGTHKHCLTLQDWLTVRDAIGDLPYPPETPQEHPEYPNHSYASMRPITVERFSHVPQGGGWKDIPYNMRLECHKKSSQCEGNSGKWPDSFGRLWWDKPAVTITGGCLSFTKGRFGHPGTQPLSLIVVEQDRTITPREAARLQSFPDDFVFFGNTKVSICQQIGNAVPPLMAEWLGSQIKSMYTKRVSKRVQPNIVKVCKLTGVKKITLFNKNIDK